MARISAPTWLEDTATRCRVFFSGTGQIQNQQHSLGFFVSPNNNWWIPTLNVSEGRRAIGDGGDFVNIVAGTAMQHVVQPPGAAHVNDFPFGKPASLHGPAMNAAAFPKGGFMRHAVDVVHAVGHIDRYEITLTINVRGARITAYRVSFSAEHIVPVVPKKEQKKKQRPSARRRG
jgi:hypothetical protein